MRPMLLAAAALIVSPIVLSAQSNTLQAKLSTPKTAASVAAAEHNADTTAVLKPISTGVTAPHLIHTVQIAANPTWRWESVSRSRTVVVGMIVDKEGKPTDLKIVRSAGEGLDKNVLEAVSQYRFQPATVSHQPMPIELNLEIEVINSQIQ